MAQLANPPSALNEPLSPEEVAQIRRHFGKYIVEAMPSIRRGLLGQEHWTTQRLGLFKSIVNKVIPDLNATFSQVHHTHDDLSKLSRAELERIAYGLASKSASLNADPDAAATFRAEVLPADVELQPELLHILPDPDEVDELPDHRLTVAPVIPEGTNPNPVPQPKYSKKELARRAQRTQNSPLGPLLTDPTVLKTAFSLSHHYYAYPPDGSDPVWLGHNPAEWCNQNGFDKRAVARVAHGYPNVARGVPYIQRIIRGWGFSCQLKPDFEPPKGPFLPGPDEPQPPIAAADPALWPARKATKKKVAKRVLRPRMTREERLKRREEKRAMEKRIAKAKADGVELTVRLKAEGKIE